MPDAWAEFAGQTIDYGCSYTLELGSQPGTARAAASPDFARLPPVGPLVLHYQRTKLVLRDCRLGAPSRSAGADRTPEVQYTIEDRRWKWQFGERLDGSYNVERKNGKLQREKSPRELAKLIFEALGEPDADVSKLPSKPRPERIWRGADPREELDRLCQEFDCAPAYNPWTDKAYIAKLGKGSSPTGDELKSRANSNTSPPIPDRFEIIGGNTLYQSAWKITEWLALEVDGKYVPEGEVSYKPATGWQYDVRPDGTLYFDQLETTYVDKATGKTLYHRDLAEQSLYRVARIKEHASGGFSPAELKGKDNEPKSIKDIGPFPGTVLEKDPLTGARLPAYVRGVFAETKSGDSRNTKPGSRYHGSVSINNDLRIVTFDKAIFKYDDNMQAVPATDLELVAAYEVTHEGVPLYYVRDRDMKGKTYGAGAYRDSVEEIVREVIEKMASADGKAHDNKKECDQRADYYIDELRIKFVSRPASQIAYSGIFRYVPDGILRSVTWSFSVDATPETVVAYDCEQNHYITPYERNEAALLRRQIEAAKRREAAKAARVDSRDRVARNVTT